MAWTGGAWCRVRRVATRRRGVRHASGVARSSRDEVEGAHASKMPAVTAGTSSGGGPRAMATPPRPPCARGDASRRRGTCPCTWTASDRRRRDPRNQPRRDGGVPRRSAGAARAAVGAAVDAVDAANARPARVVVRGVGVVAPAVPATPRGLAHGRTPVARRRVVVGGRGTGKCVLMVLDGQYVFALKSPRIKTQVLRKLSAGGAARLPATALGARRIS